MLIARRTFQCLVRNVVPLQTERTKKRGLFCSSLRRDFSYSTQDHSKGAPFNLKPRVCYYKSLNVSTGATLEEIKQAFQKLAKRLHPDVNPEAGSDGRFKEVMDAYEVLSDKEKRELYDTSIGIFDPDWGTYSSKTGRFWSGDHQAMMEEEIERMKGRDLDPRLKDPFESKYSSIKDKRLSEEIFKATPQSKVAEEEKPESREDYLNIDGVKQDPEKMYQYFKAKYIKNPEVETADPLHKLKFTKNIYNTMQKRRNEYEEQIEDSNSNIGNFRVSKKVEQKFKNPNMYALRNSFPFILVSLVFFILYWSTTSPGSSKNKLSTNKIRQGEGIIGKLSPV